LYGFPLFMQLELRAAGQEKSVLFYSAAGVN